MTTDNPEQSPEIGPLAQALSDEYLSYAPCLAEGPLAEAGTEFLTSSLAMGRARGASLARATMIVHLFETMEEALRLHRCPKLTVVRALKTGAAYFHAVRSTRLGSDVPSNDTASEDELIVAETGRHYGKLFSAFSGDSFWEEPLELLRVRLERNGIQIEELEEKSVLDAGCGGGRYTAAWRKLGAREAVGIDASEIGIEDARNRISEADLVGVDFLTGNVLSLPLADDLFDIVFSNGVLHHTEDWNRGVRELVRVLKPGGLGWLYVIENPGGVFWDTIEILRATCAGMDRAVARAVLATLGLPPNRIFYMLDHVLVPINVRLTEEEVHDSLSRAGAVAIRRLNRGADFDRVEHIFQGTPHAESMFGVGEHRFVFSKS